MNMNIGNTSPKTQFHSLVMQAIMASLPQITDIIVESIRNVALGGALGDTTQQQDVQTRQQQDQSQSRAPRGRRKSLGTVVKASPKSSTKRSVPRARGTTVNQKDLVEQILQVMKEDPTRQWSRGDIMLKLSVPQHKHPAVTKALSTMREQSLIRREGDKGGATYTFSEHISEHKPQEGAPATQGSRKRSTKHQPADALASA